MDDAGATRATSTPLVNGVQIRVRGLVQGVGFRPAVWRIANGIGIAGEVLNDGEGVLIRAWGTQSQLADLAAALARDPPPLARVDAVETIALAASPPADPSFKISASLAGAVSTSIVADAATCPSCLSDVLDPANRRYRYPFTNCTHCGPRLSIVRTIPYDRATTSMAAFPMCEDCRAEYENPADRRFHAEPNACPRCGPRAWLEDKDAAELPLDGRADAIATAATLIRAGAIIAIKGIGGFHLACDAANAAAVLRLRQLKRRYHKPFALMARDPDMIRRYADVTGTETALLGAPAAPILVLDTRREALGLAPALAPGQTTLGFMLPYTPLHHLLMRDLDDPIVLTSGNISDEPQCIGNEEARDRLAGVADYWLMHDREIVNRLDDSVAHIAGGRPSILRRARGFAPEPLSLASGFESTPRVLALGAELKSTFAMQREGKLVVSQHIGDLEDAAAHADFRRALALYRKLMAFDPDLIAVDMHRDYLSTQWGAALAAETGARLVSVQHHHAHIAAVLAEHRHSAATAPVLGIVLDGLGMGDDGHLWGGELMKADFRGFARLATFSPAALIGGNRAMREPWRNSFAHLDSCIGWPELKRRQPDLDIVRLIEGRQPAVLKRMMENGLNAPLASSAGRFLDAAAAIIGIHPEQVSYEGQAAIEMEALAAPMMEKAAVGYPVLRVSGSPLRLSWDQFWPALIDDLAGGAPAAMIAARVHRSLIESLSSLAFDLCRDHGIDSVVLSGGVMQNRLLLAGIAGQLRARGLTVLTPSRLPANDGGISAGQATIAALT